MAFRTPTALAMVRPGPGAAGRAGRPGRPRRRRTRPGRGGASPAGVLGQGQGSGGDRHHQQQRGTALAQRLPVTCQTASDPVSRRPRPASRSPARAATGSSRSVMTVPARQRQRGGEREHRVDHGVRAGAPRGVAPQLPAREERQHHEGQVRACRVATAIMGCLLAPDQRLRHRRADAEHGAEYRHAGDQRDDEGRGGRVQPGSHGASRCGGAGAFCQAGASGQQARPRQADARRSRSGPGGGEQDAASLIPASPPMTAARPHSGITSAAVSRVSASGPRRAR